MRTTIEIADELMRTAKKRAADENATLRELMDRALRQYFAVAQPNKEFRLRWKPHPRGKLRSGVVLEDRNSLFDAMEGRRVIAVDTNILIYAARQESQHHRQAVKLITGLAEHGDPWAIPWPCAYEFLRVVTHARVFSPPSSPEDAMGSLKQLMESPSLHMLGDGPGHFRYSLKAMRDSAAAGNLVHDAHIAALCLEHGVSGLYTMDRDFSRFPGLKIIYPFQHPDN